MIGISQNCCLLSLLFLLSSLVCVALFQEIIISNNWLLSSSSSSDLDVLCSTILSTYAPEVEEIRGGNKRKFGFLTGQMIKLAKEKGMGNVNPKEAADRLLSAIGPVAEKQTPNQESKKEKNKSTKK